MDRLKISKMLKLVLDSESKQFELKKKLDKINDDIRKQDQKITEEKRELSELMGGNAVIIVNDNDVSHRLKKLGPDYFGDIEIVSTPLIQLGKSV